MEYRRLLLSRALNGYVFIMRVCTLEAADVSFVSLGRRLVLKLLLLVNLIDCVNGREFYLLLFERLPCLGAKVEVYQIVFAEDARLRRRRTVTPAEGRLQRAGVCGYLRSEQFIVTLQRRRIFAVLALYLLWLNKCLAATEQFSHITLEHLYFLLFGVDAFFFFLFNGPRVHLSFRNLGHVQILCFHLHASYMILTLAESFE